MKVITKYAPLILFGTALSSTAAFGCPDGYYNTVFGVCLPTGETVGGVITKPITETVAVSGGVALEQWINASRNSAQGGNPQGVPPHIRYQLQSEFPQHVLDRARFKVGDNGFFNAARNIMFNNDVTAVTLDHIIVFRNANDAMNNVPLWAHELRHVQQFAEWGVRDFSIRYVRDSGAVEGEAYDKERQIANRGLLSPPPVDSNPYGTQQGPMSYPPMTVSIPVRFCQTPAGTCSIPPAYVPMGTSCYCTGQNGSRWDGTAF